MIYEIITMNGRGLAFEADSVETEGDTYKFFLGYEVVAQFNEKNIAGYIALDSEEEEDDY